MTTAASASTTGAPAHCTGCGGALAGHRIAEAIEGHRCPGCGACVATLDALRAACPAIVRADLVPGDPLGACRACGHATRRLAYRGYPAMVLGECEGCGRLQADDDAPFGRYVALNAQFSDPEAMRALGREVAARHGREQVMGELAGVGAHVSRRPVPFVGTQLAALILPIGAERHATGRPWATLGLLLVTFATSLVMFGDGDEVWTAFSLWPRAIPDAPSAGLLLHMLVHADLLHLLGNLYFLWLFAPAIEDRVGRVRLVGLYVGLGLLAGLAWRHLTPVTDVPAVGASGAIAGLMGLYTIWCWERRMKVLMQGGVVTMPAFLFLAVWFVFQIVYWSLDAGLVAWEAHIGGFLGGIGVALLWRPKLAA